MRYVLLCAMLGALIVPAANATDVTIGGGPVTFLFGDVGSGATGNPYAFNGPATITVTDGFLVGDQFAVYDGTTFLGDTSVPNTSATGVCTSYAVCILDPDYSHGTFTVGSGTHDIDFYAIASPFNWGNAFFELDSAAAATDPSDPPDPPAATPEPGSLALLGTGMLGFAGVIRRKLAR